MNKLFVYILTAVVVAFSSCTSENYLKYDTSWKDGIYIEQFITVEKDSKEVKEEIDSTFYNFGFSSITEHTINVRCVMMGAPKDVDREIKIKTNNSKYASETFEAASGTYYVIPESVIMPKGEVETTIPVKLLRHPDLETKSVILTMELVTNDNFETKGNFEFTITFDDKTPTTPVWWTKYDMGAFHKEKGQKFFEYFWDLEASQKYIFDQIVKRWGRNLDKGPFTPGYLNSPLILFDFTFSAFVKMRLYEYAQANPGQKWDDVSKPSIY